MIFRIKPKHAIGFKIWLELLGYVKKVLNDGSVTFTGKGTKKTLSYVFLGYDLSGNSACQVLFEEYEIHLRSPEISDETNNKLVTMVAAQLKE